MARITTPALQKLGSKEAVKLAVYQVFIGTYSKGEGNGLFYGQFDEATGSLKLLDSIDIENPSYLQLSGNILYGVSEVDTFDSDDGGAVFSVSAESNGKMRILSVQGTHGKSPCHLCVYGKYIFTANYSEGTLSIHETDADGNINPSYISISHYGKGHNPARQKKSHVHYAAMDSTGDYLAVCDLGLDKIFFYPCATDMGLSVSPRIIGCPPGSGPRHLAFSTDGRYLYVLTELHNTVLVYKYEKGNALLIQEISTLPVGFTGTSYAAAIHLSPDAAFIAVSNRGHDSVAVFHIGGDGLLQQPVYIMTGTAPRDFSYSPNGKWILSANQKDNSVTVYKTEQLDNCDGIAEQISLPCPVCIKFGSIILETASEIF